MINDRDLHEITKTDVIGLDKMKFLVFIVWLSLIRNERNELDQWH